MWLAYINTKPFVFLAGALLVAVCVLSLRQRPESPPEARVSMGLVRALALHRLAKPTGRHGLVQHCSMERADAPVQLAGSRAVPGGK